MADNSFNIPRQWWGKIAGGLLGLLKGGLPGVFVGLFLGHIIDRLVFGLSGKQRTRQLFFKALFSCLGQVNKADGRVTESEIAAAESLMRRLQLDEEERRLAIVAFNDGKAPDWDMEGHLQEFSRFTMVRHDLRQMFMEILLEGAASDGQISPEEQAVLVRIATAVRIPPAIFSAMFNAFGATHAGGGYRGPETVGTGDLSQAYKILGVEVSARDAEVKKAYRKLVSQYHPDRLISQGLPEEVMEKSKNRVREINIAYDRIKQARGFK